MNTYEKRTIDYYEVHAQSYDKEAEAQFTERPSSKFLLHFLKDQSYSDYLDIGCGTGHLLAHLSQRKPAHYHGLDISPDMIACAQAKNLPHCDFQQGKADDLPFADESMDVISNIYCFHHYVAPDKAMAEAHRLLRPGGFYIVSDGGFGGLLAKIQNTFIFPRLQTGGCHMQNRQEMEARMIKNGFLIYRSIQHDFFTYTVVGQKPQDKRKS